VTSDGQGIALVGGAAQPGFTIRDAEGRIDHAVQAG
jgi:hypothetical protein